jgi:alpha-tubulin suppressor-like RCC1 family protein
MVNSLRTVLRRLAGTAIVTLAACNLEVVNPNTGRAIPSPTPVFGGTTFTQLSSGFFHSCALTNALLRGCDLGTCSFVPVTAGDNKQYRTIAAGTTHTCGISTDNLTYCWGGTTVASAPILGDGSTVSTNAAIRVRTDSAFTAIALGGAHSCGLTASGVALCWGRNESGQLGDSTQVARGTPVRVLTSQRFTQLSAGADFTCGLTGARAIYCWGSNAFGQLGTGDVIFNVPRSTLIPTLVTGTNSWSALSSGGSHACAIATDGRIWCWGRNNDASQLGDSSGVTHRGVPGLVRSALTFTSIQAGAGTTCARTASGENWCWGGNAFGAVGNGRTSNTGEAVPSRPLAGPYTQIAPGGSHSCGIEVGGTTRCWGDAYFGALGIR